MTAPCSFIEEESGVILSPMTFKTFVWPHNPRVYAITYERKMAVYKIPFGRHFLQSLGQTRRVFKGEGEFVGEGAYDKFKELATVFYEETPGVLVHPVWVATTAWFVGLEVEQEPRSDYVRYSFEFWEVDPSVSSRMERQTAIEADGGTGRSIPAGQAQYHTVVQGDTLWGIARTYGVSLEELVRQNRQIKNPNLIHIGQKVQVGGWGAG